MMIFNSGRKAAPFFFLLILFPLVCFGQISQKDSGKPESACFSSAIPGSAGIGETGKLFTIEPPLADFIDHFSTKYSVDKNSLNCLFKKTSVNHTAIRLMKPSTSGKTKNWQAYRQRMIEPVRVNAGVRFWNKYEKYLDKAEKKYGVPAYIIVGIIGIETIYGKDTGRFRTLDALTTLAFYYPDTPNKASRQEFFRKELEQFLLLSSQNQVDPLSIYRIVCRSHWLASIMPGSTVPMPLISMKTEKSIWKNSPIEPLAAWPTF